MCAVSAVVAQRAEKIKKKKKIDPPDEGTDVNTHLCRCAGPRGISGGGCDVAPASRPQREPRAEGRRRPLRRRPGALARPLCLSGVRQRHRHEPRWEAEGGRESAVASSNMRSLFYFYFFFCPLDTVVYFRSVMPLFLPPCRDTCTATARPSRRWTAAPPARHPQLVVRRFPKPLHFPFRRKPLTSTCVSFSSWLTDGFVELRLSVNSKRKKKKKKSTVYQILTKYCISLLWI